MLRWDISIERLLHWIDGVSCVRKIAEHADVSYGVTHKFGVIFGTDGYRLCDALFAGPSLL
jgi:hypothetical protein